MKLYSRTGASAVIDGDHGSFDVADDGSVEVPDDLGRKLHIVHINGKRAWEDEAERHARLVEEELARRKDPASLYEAVEALTRQLAGSKDDDEDDESKKSESKPAPARKRASRSRATKSAS